MKNLNLVCPINSLGYGISSYNIWHNIRTSVNVTLFPIGNVSTENHWDKNAIIEDIQKQSKYNTQNPCLKIWHPHDLLMKPHGTGSYAGYSFFETNKISVNDRICYNILDNIITPTNWAKDILIANGIDINKIHVAAPGVDMSIFNPELYNQHEEDKTEDYIFLNIGKWEIRKGHDVLVHMFNQAFESTDNVRLLMLNTNPFLSDKENKQWQNLYKNTKLGDKIYMLPRLSSQSDIAKVIALSDCGIYPARAEGWNNEGIETMAMNKPIILTNYSGHTEYADHNNSFLINITTLETAHDGYFFNGNSGEWAKLDNNALDQTIAHMRHVYKNQIKTNPNGLKTAQKFSWSKTAQHIKDIIYG